MTIHFQKEIEKLKKMLLTLGTLVEESVYRSIQAIEDMDAQLAQKVIDGDTSIDQMEIEIEEECLKILALYQPVASDLRYIVTALKINQDLERIGDLAHNNAKRVARIQSVDFDPTLIDLKQLGNLVRNQLRKALDSFIGLDADLAENVRAGEPSIDLKNKEIKALIAKNIKEKPQFVDSMLHYKTLAKNLERTADHANNIAENVIYLVQGRIARHNREEI